MTLRGLRTRLLFVWVMASVTRVFSQGSEGLSSFDKEKFEQWQKQGSREQIPWKIRLFSTGPSFHQRLSCHIEIEADADHILKHSKTGRVIAMIQLTDSKGEVFRNDGKIELAEMEKVRNANVVFSWDAFVLPGDYSAELALFDPQSEEHNFARQRLRIPALKSDPLADAWQGLPSVEYLAPKDYKDIDRLFHPDIDGKLKLQMATKRPLRIELLADFTPSEIFAGSHTAYTAYLAGVIPTLKVFSQIMLPNGKLDVATLNLKDKKVVFEEEINSQSHANASTESDTTPNGLDWTRLKNSLKESDPSTVNVRVLQDRHPTPVFLRDELVRRITAGSTKVARDKSPPLRVYVLLSGSLDTYSFNGPVFSPIPESLPEQCGCLIYYLEYEFFWGRTAVLKTTSKVEKMFKPFKVRAFTVSSANDVRRAIATILDEIAKADSD
ncbi:MAG TPA: hypothetical protein VHA33_11500 [Candidatus Angelobacter sp.]|nr:hypothetical protein [Candidatus Angelobacter sp.]